jgi:hypothetical protein
MILLGFFLSAKLNNQPLLLLPATLRNVSYAIARLLARFELLLFALAIIIVARRNTS